MQSSYPVGSLVKHNRRPDVPLWVVIGSFQKAHLLRSIPDAHGNYEVIRGDGPNLTLILGMSFQEMREGISNI